MKAADLPDSAVLLLVGRLNADQDGWTTTQAVAARFPEAPGKVVAAKLRRLLHRGLLDGCACGCRGDWELTAAGAEAVDAPADMRRWIARRWGTAA